MAQSSSNIDTKLIKLLNERNIPFELLPHSKPVFTCEDAAMERKVPIGEMVKCLILVDKNTGRYYMGSVLGDKRVSLSKLRKYLKSL